jgi:hypothetical protein
LEIAVLTQRARFFLSSNKRLFQVDDKDDHRTIMTMRELMLLESEEEVKAEKTQIMRRDPSLGVVISDLETYNFLKLLMGISEDHYDDNNLFSPTWLRKNLQNVHGAVRFFTYFHFAVN